MEINQNNFNERVVKNSVPSLVDFYAPWCGPCKALAPVLDGLEKQYDGKINIIKIDVDSNPNLANEYNIRSVPTLLFFKDGNIISTIKGALPKQKIEETINSLI